MSNNTRGFLDMLFLDLVELILPLTSTPSCLSLSVYSFIKSDNLNTGTVPSSRADSSMQDTS